MEESLHALLYLILAAELLSLLTGATFVHYLRTTGLAGLLIPCVWGPSFLGSWDRRSHTHAERWGAVGVTEIPLPSPFYRPSRHAGLRAIVVWLFSTTSVAVAIIIMLLVRVL